MFEPKAVENIIESALRRKFANFRPKASYMPFHTSLLGKDRMALFSFIHSLNTTFGTAIFEHVAKEIAEGVFDEVKLQHSLEGTFSSGAQAVITDIMNGLSGSTISPDHKSEMERIAEVAKEGKLVKKDDMPLVDVFLSNKNKVFLIDLKTVKPNKGDGREYKRTLMEWSAASMYRNPNASVEAIIAMPYNPDHPKEYERWTLVGMLENHVQLLVGPEFWNFLAGGEDIYDDLVTCFYNVGSRMRDEIDSYFETFRESRYI